MAKVPIGSLTESEEQRVGAEVHASSDEDQEQAQWTCCNCRRVAHCE